MFTQSASFQFCEKVNKIGMVPIKYLKYKAPPESIALTSIGFFKVLEVQKSPTRVSLCPEMVSIKYWKYKAPREYRFGLKWLLHSIRSTKHPWRVSVCPQRDKSGKGKPSQEAFVQGHRWNFICRGHHWNLLQFT